ncbi:MAG: ATP-binding cassette domain-containing protein [Kiritimatiellae bacterium]|nr:ATP-binding cassette domain-containing protein [Kiritimatiellia bacterium]
MNSEPLLRIRNLKTWFPVKKGVFARTVGYVRAVDDVSLDIYDGETLGVVGESGCGKSTLARTILRLEKPRAGSILMNGEDVLTMTGAQLKAFRRSVQVVFQNPQASLNPRHTVLELVTEAMLAYGLTTREQRQTDAAKLLDDVGMSPDVLDRYPHEFSGGQRQRISIARALSLSPKLLICDEAVSALDLSVRAQVLNLLEELRVRHNLSYLFITHDIAVVEHISDRIAVMYLGKIVETGTTAMVLNSPAHPYTRLLMRAVPRIGTPLPEDDTPPVEVSQTKELIGCPFAPRCPLADDYCRLNTPPLEALKSPDHLCACFKAG